MQKISCLQMNILKIFLLSGFVVLTACQSMVESNFEPPQEVIEQAQRDLDFHWPLKDFRISRGFGAKRGKHKGLDLSAPKNTPVYATENGIVRVVKPRAKGYGKLIVVEHKDNQWTSYYAHLNAMAVQPGQPVHKGELLGFVGRTGRATGNHLHFEIRWNEKPIDPYPLLRVSDENFQVSQRTVR